MSPLTWLPLISRTCRTGAENATAAAAASSQKRAREAATFDTHRAAQIRTQLACLVCLSVTTEVRSVHVTHLKETTREETTCSSCLCQTCLARLDIMRTQTCPYRCSGRILHFTAGVSPQALFLLETERTECSACGDTMLFKDLEAHEAGECPGVLVECSVAGCGVHVPRSSLEMHMHEAKDRHLEVLLRELTATRSRLEQSAEERKRAETQARVWQGRAGQIAASMSARLLNDSAYLARFATDVVPHLLPSRTAALQAGVPPSAAPLVPPACLVGLLACAFEGRLIRAVRATVQYLLFGSRFRDHARLLATVGATGASLGATLAVEVRAQLQRQRQQPQPPPPPRDLLLLLAVLLKAPAPTRRTSMERLTALAREAACFSMVTLCESLGRLELVAQETYLPAAAALSAAEDQVLRSHAEMLRLQKSKRKNAKQALEAHAVEHQELKDRLARHRAILEGKAGPQLEIYREGAETALALAVEALGGEVTGIESSRCLRAYIVWWIRSCGARRGAGAAEEEGEEEAPEVRAVAQEIAAGI